MTKIKKVTVIKLSDLILETKLNLRQSYRVTRVTELQDLLKVLFTSLVWVNMPHGNYKRMASIKVWVQSHGVNIPLTNSQT